MISKKSKISIIGSGIGGLSTALSLHAAGYSPEIITTNVNIQEEVGIGINLMPHAIRELTELHLGEKLKKIGVIPQKLIYTGKHGEMVWTESVGLSAGYNWPQISIDRNKLNKLLFETVVERLGRKAIRENLTLEGFKIHPNGVNMKLSSGVQNSTLNEETELLIGADGINSNIRKMLYPNEGAPLRNGIYMFRGVSKSSFFLGGKDILVAGTKPGEKFIAYPISEKDSNNEGIVNWVLEIMESDAERESDLSKEHYSPSEVLKYMDDYQFPWIDHKELIEKSIYIYCHPMHDRNPIPKWSFDRVTLLGDAAHPMYPMGMNGGTQSIIDGRVLAWTLSNNNSIEEALQDYDAKRRPLVNRIVLNNRFCGPERVIDVAFERAANNTSPYINEAEFQSITENYKSLAGSNKDYLNSRSSWTVELQAH